MTANALSRFPILFTLRVLNVHLCLLRSTPESPLAHKKVQITTTGGESSKSKTVLVVSTDSDSGSSEEATDSPKSLVREAIILPWWFTGYPIEYVVSTDGSSPQLPNSMEISRRIQAFLEYRDSNLRMALARVPATANWGRGRYSAFLCVGGEPIRLWVLGTMQDISYTASDVISRAGCHMVIGLLRDVDRESLHMLHSKSYPSNGECAFLRLLITVLTVEQGNHTSPFAPSGKRPATTVSLCVYCTATYCTIR